MFGYATDETEEAMPLTLLLAHQLNAKLHAMRRSGELEWARPDSKSQVRVVSSIIFAKSSFLSTLLSFQVTIEYRFEGGACVPLRVHTVVMSAQHSPAVTLEQLRNDIREKVIDRSTLSSHY